MLLNKTRKLSKGKLINLKRKGGIVIKRSEEDKRKKVYRLISPENAVGELEDE